MGCLGTLDTIAQGNATNGAVVWKTLYLQAGDTVTFNWNFDPNEHSTYYKDFAFAAGGGNAERLAYASGNQQTGWKNFTYSATYSGEHKLGVGVMNYGDQSVDSELYVDNFKLNGSSSFGDISGTTLALNQAKDAYDTAVKNKDDAYDDWQDAIDVSDAKKGLYDTAKVAYDTALTNKNDAYDDWQDAIDVSNAKEGLYDTAKAKSDGSYNNWQTAIGTTAQKLKTKNDLEPLQHQTDRLVIPQAFTLMGAAFDAVTGDLTFSYTQPDGTGLLAAQHTSKVIDHDVDPIDEVMFDANGDGSLSTFAVATNSVAANSGHTLVIGLNTEAVETLSGV